MDITWSTAPTPGTTVIKVAPASASSIYDEAGNAMSVDSSATTPIDAPEIIGLVATGTNPTAATVTFSEGVYGDNAHSTALASEDLSVMVVTGLGASPVLNITAHVLGAASLTMDITWGTPPAVGDVIKVAPATASSIYDYDGHAMSVDSSATATVEEAAGFAGKASRSLGAGMKAAAAQLTRVTQPLARVWTRVVSRFQAQPAPVRAAPAHAPSVGVPALEPASARVPARPRVVPVGTVAEPSPPPGLSAGKAAASSGRQPAAMEPAWIVPAEVSPADVEAVASRAPSLDGPVQPDAPEFPGGSGETVSVARAEAWPDAEGSGLPALLTLWLMLLEGLVGAGVLLVRRRTYRRR
jgi:hypothetical protein